MRAVTRLRCALVALVAGVTMAGVAGPAAAAKPAPPKAPSCPGVGWVADFYAGAQASTTWSLLGPSTIANRTFRITVAPHLPGQAVRLHLGNTMGAAPIVIDDVRLARSGGGAVPVPGTNRAVKFGGSASVVIAPGAEAISDPVALKVKAYEQLLVSVHPQGTVPVDQHHLGLNPLWITPPGSGDHTADVNGAAFTTPGTYSYLVSGIDVLTTRKANVVAVLGDSITDGFGTPLGQDDRWVDFLSRDLMKAGKSTTVLNAGITGNQVVTTSAYGGLSAVARVSQVTRLRGLTAVIVYEGINDINQKVPLSQIEVGLTNIASQLHKKHLKAYIATLTPEGGRLPYTHFADPPREALNQWIRSQHSFDAVIDLDAAVRDPRNHAKILSSFDDDHLHMTSPGNARLARAVPYDVLKPKGCLAAVTTNKVQVFS